MAFGIVTRPLRVIAASMTTSLLLTECMPGSRSIHKQRRTLPPPMEPPPLDPHYQTWPNGPPRLPTSPSIAPSAISPSHPSPRALPAGPAGMRRSLLSKSTMPAACTGISAWSTTACCGAGRSRKAPRPIRRTSASRSMWKTTRWTTPTSRAPSPRASMAPAWWRPGTAAPGSRKVMSLPRPSPTAS